MIDKEACRSTKLWPKQGVLISLLITFLSSESNRRLWFKIYVVCVNIFTAGQTVSHVIQVYDVIGSVPAPAPVSSLSLQVVHTQSAIISS